jgi:hypothetical protein
VKISKVKISKARRLLPRNLSRPGGGSTAAYDDTTLAELWKTNVGSGFNAPPMTVEVNGRQFDAIASGIYATAKGS